METPDRWEQAPFEMTFGIAFGIAFSVKFGVKFGVNSCEEWNLC